MSPTAGGIWINLDKLDDLRCRVQSGKTPALFSSTRSGVQPRRRLTARGGAKSTLLVAPLICIAQAFDTSLMGLMHLSKDRNAWPPARRAGPSNPQDVQARPCPARPPQADGDRQLQGTAAPRGDDPRQGLRLRFQPACRAPARPRERWPAREEREARKERHAECRPARTMRATDIRKKTDEKGFSTSDSTATGMTEGTKTNGRWWLVVENAGNRGCWVGFRPPGISRKMDPLGPRLRKKIDGLCFDARWKVSD